MDHHLAQINIGRLVAPIDHPRVADFFDSIDRINALAEASAGFVWRLQTEAGNATDIRAFDDPLMIVNMSVWETLEALRDYAYKSDHVGFVRRRRDWFAPHDGPHMALWWVPSGSLPTLADGKVALDALAADGPTPRAFVFSRPFPPPGSARTAA